MGLIYKIINDINDKVYIGKTTRTIEIRWKDHTKYLTNYKIYIIIYVEKEANEYVPLWCCKNVDW